MANWCRSILRVIGAESDVARFVDGRAAEIHADLAGLDGFKGLFGFREGVVDADHGEEGLGLRF